MKQLVSLLVAFACMASCYAPAPYGPRGPQGPYGPRGPGVGAPEGAEGPAQLQFVYTVDLHGNLNNCTPVVTRGATLIARSESQSNDDGTDTQTVLFQLIPPLDDSEHVTLTVIDAVGNTQVLQPGQKAWKVQIAYALQGGQWMITDTTLTNPAGQPEQLMPTQSKGIELVPSKGVRVVDDGNGTFLEIYGHGWLTSYELLD